MELNVRNSTEILQLSDTIFNTKFNEPLIHQVMVAYLAGARSGTKAQKTRAMVSGGNSKPWRQKGTGRARAGTTRGPLWRTGGRAFAAQPRNFEQKVNRKMYRGAMRSILAELIRSERLVIVDAAILNLNKTKMLVAKLQELNCKHALIVTDAINEGLSLAARNLHNVNVLAQHELDPVSLIKFDYTLITPEAMKKLEGRLV
jgi:large subunit ribosomal protein L4